MTEIRVLHWNIHSWTDDTGEPNGERVADLIRKTTPDIVSLVEVDEESERHGTLSNIAKSCGYTSIFCPAFEFGDIDGPRGTFGNAILTRLPILAIRHRHLLWPVPSYDGSEASEARTATLAQIATDSGQVTAITTHLPRGDGTARKAAIARLTSIATTADRWFIVGDFNTPPDWANQHHLTVAPRATPTYPAANPHEAIDYIVTSAPLQVTAEVLRELGSDHFPVLATISLH